ncbi:MAG TPA: aldehyde ferredoxin oxidoreductase C-terminal domain-containing protein, partial [Acidobacteriota bacterium]|nr:aldehyde ferredoxin oxidoreductase C-terminal domain-containing protein [Acidobacteriota bacterium]
TAFPCSGRISVGAKSPMTGGIKEANAGGAMAQKLARLGIKAVIFEGQAKEPTSVKIDNGGVSFSPASSYAGLGCYAIIEKLKSEFGEKVCVSCIGPAGDRQLAAASIQFTTPDFHIRIAARGGLGAVMGSKNLKTVVVDDTGSNLVEIKDKARMRDNIGPLTKTIVDDHFVGLLRRFGTPVILGNTNVAGALPTQNFSRGQFEKADQLSGEHMEELLKGRPNSEMVHSCMNGCIISCSNIYTDEKGELISSAIEYESLALIGPNCLIGDLDSVVRINRACNDVGVDTMDIGSALAVAMEAGMLPWGDGEAALKLVQNIARGDENSLIIGSGVKVAGEKLGVRRVPHVKGQGFAGYDPRILKGTGVTFATSPQGADHTAGLVIPGPWDPEYNPTQQTEQGRRSKFMQAWMAAVDTLGLCMMIGMPIREHGGELYRMVINCVSALNGEDLDDNYLIELGSSVLEIERKFNKAAGFTGEDDRLPKFFSEEAFGPGAPLFDIPEEEIDSVFNA